MAGQRQAQTVNGTVGSRASLCPQTHSEPIGRCLLQGKIQGASQSDPRSMKLTSGSHVCRMVTPASKETGPEQRGCIARDTA